MKLALLALLIASPAWAQQPADHELLATTVGAGAFTGQVDVDGDRVLASTFDGASHALVLERALLGWTVVDELVPSVPAWRDEPTTCVALDGDHALVGYGRSRRAAFFERGATGWVQTQVVEAPSGTFASSFATAAGMEGDLAILGVSSNVNHRNLVFRRAGGTWVETQTLGVGRLTDVEIGGGLVVLGNGFRNGEIQGHSSAISGQVSIAPVLANGDVGTLVTLPGPPFSGLVEGRLGMSVATDGSFVSATWSSHPGAFFGFEMTETFVVTWKESGGVWVVDSTHSYPGNTNNTDLLGYGLAWDGKQLVTGLAGFGYWSVLRESGAGSWEAVETLHGTSSLTIDHRTIDASSRWIVAVAGGSPIGLLDNSGAYERLLIWSPPVGEDYCTAQPNSTGRTARVFAAGSTAVADQRLTLGFVGLPANALALPLVAGQPGFIPNLAGSQGDLCLGAPLGRLLPLAGNAGPDGIFSVALPLTSPLPGVGASVQPGDTWYFQAWYRDSNPGPTSNFTDARSVTFD